MLKDLHQQLPSFLSHIQMANVVGWSISKIRITQEMFPELIVCLQQLHIFLRIHIRIDSEMTDMLAHDPPNVVTVIKPLVEHVEDYIGG